MLGSEPNCPRGLRLACLLSSKVAIPSSCAYKESQPVTQVTFSSVPHMAARYRVIAVFSTSVFMDCKNSAYPWLPCKLLSPGIPVLPVDTVLLFGPVVQDSEVPGSILCPLSSEAISKAR